MGGGRGGGGWEVGKGVPFKIRCPRSGGRTALDVDAQGGRGHENKTIFMDVICVSSLRISEIRLL